MRPFPACAFPRPILLLVLAAVPAATARGGELRHFEDAAVRAVQFVDQEGWAVGDEGAIWHSIDGGQNWERQPSGVRGSLRSLHFLNPYTGWVVGREELPNGAGSTGILLYTQDGGMKWRQVLLNALPGLNGIRFVDEKTGYLYGDGADSYPSGVFVTTDSGRNWQPLPGPRCPAWLAADFNAASEGALAGGWNRLATLRGDRLTLADVDALGGRNLRGLHLFGQRGIAVGEGGLILLSEGTSGSTWSYVDLKLPESIQSSLDFHAVHGSGRHLWVVGRPGSVVLHSPDQGKTWEVQRTGQALPLEGVFFRDEQHGWAVGEFGTILATADGGKTWKVRHRGGQRSAVLFLHARAAGTPLDTVALLGGDEGYLAAAVRVTCPDPATAAPARAGEGARFQAAIRQAGGAAAEMLWQFPVGSHLARAERGPLLQSWDRLHGDRAADHLLRQLVLAIRTWRPDVIVTDHPDAKASGFACDALVAEAVREAFDRAADPRAFPEHQGFLGLEPWQASKLYARWDSGPDAQVNLDLDEMNPVLETSVREWAAGPGGLVAEGAFSLPARRGYRLLADHLEGAAGHKRLMQGLSLAPGGPARRALAPVADLSPEAVKAQRQRAHLLAMATAPAGNLTDPDRLLAQIGPMLEAMPDDRAAPAAFAVANQFASQGQWNLAREAFLLMADRYPTHPLTLEAYRWLLRHNSSSEARRRHELGQFLVFRTEEFGLAEGAGKVTVPAPPQAEKKEGKEGSQSTPKSKDDKPAAGKGPARTVEVQKSVARSTEQLALIGNRAEARQWYQGALDLESRLGAFGPLAGRDPSIQFCLQAARRNLGDVETARRWYAQFVSRQPEGPWRNAAAAELWLLNRSGPAPKPVAYCRYTDTRPFLDGKLDDECWQHCPVLRLNNAAGDTKGECPTEARLAYDQDFLYLALRCVHPAGRQLAPVKPRTHDADLRPYDRVSLMLDLDRDYSTCFHLQVDQRGCVAEDCWGDRSWDPRWFVAVHSEPTEWVIEAAIPLGALTGDSVTPGKAWAFNLVRVLPAAGVQAFSLPAEVPEESLRPEGMGLLMFVRDPRQSEGASETPAPMSGTK